MARPNPARLLWDTWLGENGGRAERRQAREHVHPFLPALDCVCHAISCLGFSSVMKVDADITSPPPLELLFVWVFYPRSSSEARTTVNT